MGSGWFSKDTVKETKSQATDQGDTFAGHVSGAGRAWGVHEDLLRLNQREDVPTVKRATDPNSTWREAQLLAIGVVQISWAMRAARREAGAMAAGSGTWGSHLETSFGRAMWPGRATPGEAPRRTKRMSTCMFTAVLFAVAAWPERLTSRYRWTNKRRPSHVRGHSATSRGAGWTLAREGKEPDTRRYVSCDSVCVKRPATGSGGELGGGEDGLLWVGWNVLELDSGDACTG